MRALLPSAWDASFAQRVRRAGTRPFGPTLGRGSGHKARVCAAQRSRSLAPGLRMRGSTNVGAIRREHKTTMRSGTSGESSSDSGNFQPSGATERRLVASSMGAVEEAQPKTPWESSWKSMVTLCALSVVLCYADRSNISIAILPMGEAFGWDKTFEGIVLSAFFAGYSTTQLVGGQWADQTGAKNVLTFGVVMWSLSTCLTPAAAALGAAPVIAMRVILGLGEGVAFPAIHSLIARHVPTQHQSKSVGIVTAASYVGAALAFQFTPLIIDETSWQAAFVLFGLAAGLWLPFWLLYPLPPLVAPPALSSDPFPSSHPLSDADEPDDLEAVHHEPLLPAPPEGGSAEIGGAPGAARRAPKAPAGSSDDAAGSDRVGALRALLPLFRRKEVLAICVAQYTGSWGLYGLLNWLPTFFVDVYHVDLADLGGFTSMSYVAQGGVGFLAGYLADYMISARRWPKRDVRRGLQVIGMLGPATCLVLAGNPQVASSPEVAAGFVTVGLGLSALTLGGVSANHLDVAPRHAGVVFGAGNTAATFAGFVSVPVTGYLLDKTASWSLVLGIAAMHYVVGAVAWVFMAGGDVLEEDRM